MANALAACDNIGRMWATADRRLVLKRIEDQTYNGLAAVWGESMSGPGPADPTLAAVLGDELHDRDSQLITEWLHLSLKIERRMPGWARSTTPTRQEAESTDAVFDSDAVFRPKAGVCEACGKELIGGSDPADQIQMVEGAQLCPTHKRGRYRPKNKGRTIENYIDSIRAMRGMNL